MIKDIGIIMDNGTFRISFANEEGWRSYLSLEDLHELLYQLRKQGHDIK